MSLCDSCEYQYYVEQLKPCIVYKTDCEFYKPDEFHKVPKTGHWIIYDVHGHKACKCSECDKDVGYPCNYKYCPYCGIRTIDPQESEDKNNG